ncbi:MAG TPA: Asp23/Gls24 family envelope stress response protein [Candidatus Fraserbacteria bacterium]|nr:Asp23/Gls24 family envelope stress response protein [Candidatus Fraserbacteria bacterium]
MQDVQPLPVAGGQMSITEQVIASIAGIAATQVEGLAGMRGGMTDDLVAILGEDRQRKGVLTQRGDGSVQLALNVVVQYGYPIHEVARQLQARVKTEVEEMTGLTVSAVDVYVQDLQLPPGEELK